MLNYTKALEAAVTLQYEKGLPLTNKVLLKAHETLMHGSNQADPGNFRQQSVRVGNLIPPPAPEIPQLMKELEEFINAQDTIPPLIKAGLAHVQFETIHPFLDGNGRIGRLLIVLMLLEDKLITSPMLYPSYYFKKHQSEYYQALDRVRTDGDFEGWLIFYLKALAACSDDAYKRAKKIEELEQKIKKSITHDADLARIQKQLLSVVSFLFQFPITTIKQISEYLDKSYNTVKKMIDALQEKGILVEHTQQKRNKLYHFKEYLELLEKDLTHSS